jgi:O-antigen/teichoic acid export membrane protein
LFLKIRELSKDLAVYGVGDVAVSVVNFFLLPIYVQYLSPGDYGVLGVLGSVEVIAKIFFRWGLDGSFMRLFYECDAPAARQRLASTIFFFLLALNGFLLAASLAAAPLLSQRLFSTGGYLRILQLTLINTFVIGFTFFPFHLLRMEKRATTFGVLTLARSVATVLLRIVLVVGMGFGVVGIVVADLIVTAGLMAALLRWFAPLLRPVFSIRVLRDALRFGLPRVPHAAAQQIIAVGDKFILAALVPLAQVGVYSMGVSFGLTQKLFLSAFEYAWAPFYYANSKEPDGRRLFGMVTTYGVAILVLLTAGLSAIGRDVLVAVVGVEYEAAAPVVTWTAVGVLFQCIYLLTSIGLNITKRTQYYPVATIVAAAVNLGLNLLLVPRYGFVAAAWVNGLSYAVQAGIAFYFSQRFYAVSYEAVRLGRVALAGSIAFVLARLLPSMPAAVGVLARGSTVVVVFAGVLWLSGFFKASELQQLARLRRGAPRSEMADVPPGTTELAGEIVATELPAAPVIAREGPPRR